jgi:hypothetical protein
LGFRLPRPAVTLAQTKLPSGASSALFQLRLRPGNKKRDGIRMPDPLRVLRQIVSAPATLRKSF